MKIEGQIKFLVFGYVKKIPYICSNKTCHASACKRTRAGYFFYAVQKTIVSYYGSNQVASEPRLEYSRYSKS